MSANALGLLTAWSLLVGGALATVGWVALAIVDPSRRGQGRGRYAANGLVIGGGGLIVFGLPAIHSAQAAEAGWPGAVAILVLFVGMATAYVAVQSIEVINNGLPRHAVPLTRVAIPCLFGGAIGTAVVSWSAGVVPTALPVLLVGSIVAAGITLVPGISARVNTLASLPYTMTLAAWAVVLIRDM